MLIHICIHSRVLAFQQSRHTDKFLYGQLWVHIDPRIEGIGVGYDKAGPVRDKVYIVLGLVFCNGNRADVPQHALVHTHDNGGNNAFIQIIIIIHTF